MMEERFKYKGLKLSWNNFNKLQEKIVHLRV